MTEKIQWEAIKWPENMAPSRSPIHFTNELVVAVSRLDHHTHAGRMPPLDRRDDARSALDRIG